MEIAAYQDTVRGTVIFVDGIHKRLFQITNKEYKLNSGGVKKLVMRMGMVVSVISVGRYFGSTL